MAAVSFTDRGCESIPCCNEISLRSSCRPFETKGAKHMDLGTS